MLKSKIRPFGDFPFGDGSFLAKNVDAIFAKKEPSPNGK